MTAPPAVEHRTGAFRASDGVEIRWQAWSPPHAAAAVLLSHGLGEHGGRYARLWSLQTADFSPVHAVV